MTDIDDLKHEMHVLNLEMRALRAETTIAIADLTEGMNQRFGLLMDAIADLRTAFLGHTHNDDGSVR